MKLALFPLNTRVNARENLTLNGLPVTELTARFGTPLYVYDVATIRRQIAVYRQALAAYPGPSRLTYAGKAFLCPALAGLMSVAGLGLDVASAGELYVARQGGADPAQMHLHGNNKTLLDLYEALTAGVGRIVVDNIDELGQLSRLAAERRQTVHIWLRVTPEVAVATHHRYTVTGTADSKFGFSLVEARRVAEQLLNKAGPSEDYSPLPPREASWQGHSPAALLNLTGLHLHLGSHFHEAKAVTQASERLLNLAQWLHERYNWEFKEFCPGGGWGVRYHPADPPLPVEPFVRTMVEAIAEGCRQRGLALPEVVLEPGRSLVAQAGVALYSVGGRKVSPGGRTYVSIDGGLADNPRPALYQARYTALLANRANEPETETVAIAGPYCESGDVMIEAVDLPVARAGDILAVPVAGAYQLSMSSNYNAARRPAVVFLDEGQVKLVQRRETFEDLVRRDLM